MLGWLKELLQGKDKQVSSSQKNQKRYPPEIKYPKKQPHHEDNPPSLPGAVVEIIRADQSSSAENPKVVIHKPAETNPSPSSFSVTTSAFSAPSKIASPKAKNQIPPPPPATKAFWIPPGKTVQVRDYLIPEGMIYVGTHLKTENPYTQADPCLINPQLRVEKHRPDHEGSGISYWPSYSDITPACRSAYLEWLSGGRRDPNAYIGYVFLFFYGLERRVLKDYQTLKIDTSQELAQIVAEVEQLLAIYGNNSSFGSYGSRFLDVCWLFQSASNLESIERPLSQTGWEMPLSIKVALGRQVAESKPISVDWMLSWYLHSGRAQLRTPAIRCGEEFRKLLRLLYQQRYGEGMVIKPNRRKLKVKYNPANAGLLERNLLELDLGISDLPDITALSAPLKKLQILIDDCTDALDPYSRWIGRNGKQPDSKVALALLPPELVGNLEDEHIHQLKHWLAQTLGEQTTVVIPAAQLLAQWVSPLSERLTKKESTILAQALESLGYGIEPDVRFGGNPLKKDNQIALFQITHDMLSSPSKEYTAATLLLHLASAVVSSDAIVDAAEQQCLEEHLESALHLSTAERARLKAHLAWLLQEKFSLRGLKIKLNQMTADEKAGIANFLIGVAGADGHISPKEISMLTKIYPLLGLDADDVYSHIHTFSTSSSTHPATTPVTVRPASQTPNGFAIPAPPDPENLEIETTQAEQESTAYFTLDLTVIQHKQAESAKVANLLGDLFTDDEPETVISKPTSATKIDISIAGLDSLHSQFLIMIAQQITWDRDRLETQADELGLLLDGALEVINDAAFEVCDDPLTEGDELISVDTNVLEQLMP